MTFSYDSLTPLALHPVGFRDPERACLRLQAMAGHDVPDAAYDQFLNSVIHALEACSDPDRAVANLERWGQRVGSRRSAYSTLANSPAAAAMHITVLAASQFFADMLIDNPEYLEILTDPAVRDRESDPAILWEMLSRRVSISAWPNAKRDALRRFKAPEILRIGVRDLLGYADLRTTVEDISNFADACCRMALQICAEEMGLSDPAFIIVAMGKLGGRELNYASDIDLVFVHGDTELSWDPIKLSERVRSTLADSTEAGFIFRVDLRLRPEGRFGPVSRTMASTVAYYESWAEPWEQQALMKARVVAGSPELARQFETMAEQFVYRHRVTEEFVDSIRSNKRRLEEKIARTGDSDVNVKEGHGGIRDIEFAVQLIQLVAGGSNPALRTGNSLEALVGLRDCGLISGDEYEFLSESYVFLRTVEHRLQLLEERAVRTLPRGERELSSLGKGLGFPDGESFSRHYRTTTDRVNAAFRRLFYSQEESHELNEDPAVQWLRDPTDAVLTQAFSAYLRDIGFHDPTSAIAMMRRAISGTEHGATAPDARSEVVDIMPSVLRQAGTTSDADAASRGIDLLAQTVPSSAALYRALRDAPDLVRRMAHIASDSPFLWHRLLNNPGLLDVLSEGPEFADPVDFSSLDSLSPEQFANKCVLEQFRIGSADILGAFDIDIVSSQLTRLGEFAVDWALHRAAQGAAFNGRVAVMGLGKLGGSELGYGSDLDVCFVAETLDFAAAVDFVKSVIRTINEDLSRAGYRLELDPRLRPDGRKGPLVMDVAGYERYYSARAETWERQAATKMRFVAGDSSLGNQLASIVSNFVYGSPLSLEEAQAIRHMKRRIERERVRDKHDIKLGPGGLSDIEWLAQILQLKLGHSNRRLRSTNTMGALRKLRDDVVITQAQWDVLSTAYERFTAARNHAFLKNAQKGSDIIHLAPSDDVLRQDCRAIFESIFNSEEL